MRLRYNLHIHSCLSPCGEDDMTPHNIAGMALLGGCDVIAVTDHNTGGNVAAVCAAADVLSDGKPLLVIPGMELTTREEAHLLAYFPDLPSLNAYEQLIAPLRATLPNNPVRFGHQWLCDAQDNFIGEMPNWLILALDAGLDELCTMIRAHGGVPVPAHVDKPSNSLMANLGFVPPGLFSTLELADPAKAAQFPGYRVLHSSDSHHLETLALWQPYEIEVAEASIAGVLTVLGG